MTAQDAVKEIYAIANNMMLDYSCEKHSEKYIIEDLQETIRLFNEIIGKLNGTKTEVC